MKINNSEQVLQQDSWTKVTVQNFDKRNQCFTIEKRKKKRTKTKNCEVFLVAKLFPTLISEY